MPGPLPSENARRRNEPTIPTTNLPAGGYKGRAPKIPAAYELGDAGRAWWRWAWKTPQAAAWDNGSLYALARRAQLEDDLHAIGAYAEAEISTVLASFVDERDHEELHKLLSDFVAALQRVAGPAAAVRREMRELDDRFGLTAKGLAALRWKIVADQADKPAASSAPKPGAAARARAAGLSAVDPAG